MGVLLLFFIYWIQFWVYEYSMHALNILSLNVNGLDSAVERARVLEYLHRGSIFCALIQETYLICGTGLRHLLVVYLFVTLHSQCFFFDIHDYIKEWLVLFFLFPSLSLFLLTGLLGCWVCVCWFVLFVLSGCYVVMLCVKRNKKNDHKKIIIMIINLIINHFIVFYLKRSFKAIFKQLKISLLDLSFVVNVHQRFIKSKYD